MRVDLNKTFTNYVRRCKNKDSTDTHATLHLANDSQTLCSKQLNEMWWMENSTNLSVKDITCKKCRRRLKDLQNNKLGKL